jgi:hypothetical protein
MLLNLPKQVVFLQGQSQVRVNPVCSSLQLCVELAPQRSVLPCCRGQVLAKREEARTWVAEVELAASKD